MAASIWARTMGSVLTAIAVWAGACGHAQAADHTGLMVIYDNGSIAGVDAQTGALTPLGQTSEHPWEFIHASAYDPNADRIYIAWTSGGTAGDLYTINANTFAVERKVGLAFTRAGGMEYDTARNRLLVCSDYMRFLLWQVDPTTGAMVEVIADLDPWDLGGNDAMAYVPSEDSVCVFRGWGDEDRLCRYSFQTGELTSIRDGAYWDESGFGEMNSLCYNPADGYLYGMDAVSNRLGRIDRATGDVTTIGPTGGFAGAQSVIYTPEPATLGLLALGGLGVLLRRKRK